MSNKKYNYYSSEFKENAVKLALSSEQARHQTAKDLGVKSSTLYNWISIYSRKPSKGTSMKSDEHIYDENKRLKKELLQVKLERDLLKKASAYFAQQIK
jgi:transposase